MELKEVIATINRMQADGVIKRYAIGGAIGASFYLEPGTTLDVDVFVAFQGEAGGIIDLRPIYEYLTAKGAVKEKEYLVIAGWPVQFLPPSGPLVEEALAEAVEKDVHGTPARVFTAEHLAAIALQVGRGKDKARLVQFVEGGMLDLPRFQTILARHGLVERWQKFERLYLGDQT